MSEEKRFTNKKLIAVSIVLVLMCGMTGVLGFTLVGVLNNNTILSGSYDNLYIDHLELLYDFNTLDNQYFILTGEHIELENDYNNLVIDLDDVTAERDVLDDDLATMTAERDVLIVNLSNVINERDNLIFNLTNMTDDRNNLLGQIELLDAEIIIFEGTISGLEVDLFDMTTLRDGLQTELDILQLQYDALLGDYQMLFDANVDLQNTYDALEIAYDYICDTIRQSILPVQYSIFAEAVRRYYVDEFDENWQSFAEFCRDIVLHDSFQYNAFSEVSDAFSNALRFGSDTMYLSWYMTWLTFYPWLPNWDDFGLTGNELTDIETIVDWCIDEIDYEYDSSITTGQEAFDGDYIKFPIETIFRTMGDCEDQAILTAAYLESCGFETAIGIWHDPDHPNFTGGFFHGVLFVQIEDTDAFKLMFPNWLLWKMPNDPYLDYTWCMIDTTWNVPFGSVPTWMDYYLDNPFEFTLDDLTRAVCDIDGAIGINIGTNIDIECFIST